MSLETITIRRQYPIVNGFIQFPNNLEKNRSKFMPQDLPELELKRMSGGTGGARTGWGRSGSQEWVIFCEQLAFSGKSPDGVADNDCNTKYAEIIEDINK